jgi:hypothetical protein
VGTVLGGLALIVALSGAAIAAIPGSDATVTACISNDGSIKIVDSEAGKICRGSQKTVKLAAADANGKVANADKLDGRDSTSFVRYGGLVQGDGSTSGTGFSVTRIGAGAYRVAFPQWWDTSGSCKFPVPVVSAFRFQGQARVANIDSVTCGLEGRADFEVRTMDLAGSLVDNAFWFMVMQES